MIRSMEVRRDLTLLCPKCHHMEDYRVDFSARSNPATKGSGNDDIRAPLIMEPYAGITAYCPKCSAEAPMVDAGISRYLLRFWKLGYRTFGSCEGHRFVNTIYENPPERPEWILTYDQPYISFRIHNRSKIEKQKKLVEAIGKCIGNYCWVRAVLEGARGHRDYAGFMSITDSMPIVPGEPIDHLEVFESLRISADHPDLDDAFNPPRSADVAISLEDISKITKAHDAMEHQFCEFMNHVLEQLEEDEKGSE